MSDELPEGWCQTNISTVADVFLGKTLAKGGYGSSGKLKVVKFRDLRDSCVDFYNFKDGFVRDDEVVPGLRELRRGDVLITSAAHSGENIGKKCAYVSSLPAEFERVFFTGELLNLRCADETISRWVYFFFRSAEGFVEIQNAVTGVHLTGGRAKQMLVPLAPLAEQRRIVAKLEMLLGKVDACQQRLGRVPPLLKRFRQAVLAAACSGRLTADWRDEHREVGPAQRVLSRVARERENFGLGKSKKVAGQGELRVPFHVPNTWVLCVFDDIADTKPNAIKAGPFGSALTKACYVPSGFKVYGQEQVIRGDPDFGDYYISEKKYRELQSCEIAAGDILISLVGTIGKVLVMPEKFHPGIINPRLAKISLHPSIVRGYIAYYMYSPLAARALSQQSHGGTMEILNLGILRALPIPLPPIIEQQEIVSRVEALFALADEIEIRCARARAHLSRLNGSLLAKAFRGELVPTDAQLARAEGRDYKPASALLERIQGARLPNRTPSGRRWPRATQRPPAERRA